MKPLKLPWILKKKNVVDKNVLSYNCFNLSVLNLVSFISRLSEKKSDMKILLMKKIKWRILYFKSYLQWKIMFTCENLYEWYLHVIIYINDANV